MINIAAEVDIQSIREALGKLQRKTSNMRPIMDEIGQTIINSIEQNFAQESARQPAAGMKEKGGAWKSLNPKTIDMRRRKGKYPGKMLQVSGQLIASIQAKTSNVDVQVGTNKSYAKVQHENRPFLVIQATDLAEIEKIIEKHLKK